MFARPVMSMDLLSDYDVKRIYRVKTLQYDLLVRVQHLSIHIFVMRIFGE